MISDRQTALDAINTVLGLDQLKIERNQAIGDYSLNIHGENYFRDIFNHVFNRGFKNANYGDVNAAYIDLVDDENKEFVQITTTRTKEKIENTLKIFKTGKYKGYKIYIYYLLGKAEPQPKSVEELEKEHGIDLSDALKDSADLFKSINNLPTDKLLSLANNFFSQHAKVYTDKTVLDLVIKRLLKDMPSVKPSYDEPLVGIGTEKKIKINGLNERTAGNISSALDYVVILQDLDDGNLSADLRAFVVDYLYRRKLMAALKAKIDLAILNLAKIEALHEMALKEKIDFNKPISELADSLTSYLHVQDFNAMQIGWVIVAHYFELCDVGIKT